MLSGGCVFVDRVSGFMKIKHQVYIDDTETGKSKITFEKDDHS